MLLIKEYGWGREHRMLRSTPVITMACFLLFSFAVGWWPSVSAGKTGNQTSSAPENFLFGQLRMQQGDYEQAASYFEAAALERPGVAKPYLYLGKALEHLGRLEEAIESYNQVLTIEPVNIRAFFALGDVYRKASRWAEAVESYRQASRLDPTSAKAFFEMALAYTEWGRGEEAQDALRRAYAVNPDYVILASRLRGMEFAANAFPAADDSLRTPERHSAAGSSLSPSGPARAPSGTALQNDKSFFLSSADQASNNHENVKVGSRAMPSAGEDHEGEVRKREKGPVKRTFSLFFWPAAAVAAGVIIMRRRSARTS